MWSLKTKFMLHYPQLFHNCSKITSSASILMSIGCKVVEHEFIAMLIIDILLV